MRGSIIVSFCFLFAVASAHAGPSPLVGTWIANCEDTADGSYQAQFTFRADGQLESLERDFKAKGCQGSSEIVDVMTEPYRVSSETSDRAVLSTMIQRGEDAEGGALEMEAEFTFPVENRMEMRVLKIIAHLEHEGDISMDGLVSITPVLTFSRQ